MKIAYCMSGCIGGLTGKAGEKTVGGETVLKLAADHFFKNVISDPNDTIDIFIFSWDVHLKDEYDRVYNPKKLSVQNQITFNVPTGGEAKRFQGHHSRWYALKNVVELKNSYESQNGKYDLTVLTRLDLAWITPIGLNKLDPSVINFDQCGFHGHPYGSKTSCEIGDRFIASNSENINIIASLYDYIPEYTSTIPNMWRGISSHFMIPHHLTKFNMRANVTFPFLVWFPNYTNKYEDSHCTLVRYLK